MQGQLRKVHSRVEADKQLRHTYVPGRWCAAEEGALIAKLCAENDIRYFVESGTSNGYSACWAATVCEAVYTFDPVDRKKVYTDPDLGLSELTPKIHYYEESFLLRGAEIASKLDGNILYFLDGGRGRTGLGMTQDWVSIQSLVKKGDIVLLHDTRERTLSRLSRRIAEQSSGVPRDYDTQNGMIAVHIGKGDGSF